MKKRLYMYQQCPVCGIFLDGRRSVVPWHSCSDMPKAHKLWVPGQYKTNPPEPPRTE